MRRRRPWRSACRVARGATEPRVAARHSYNLETRDRRKAVPLSSSLKIDAGTKHSSLGFRDFSRSSPRIVGTPLASRKFVRWRSTGKHRHDSFPGPC
jgi:hypothetical protein